jgi:hypothetical protein
MGETEIRGSEELVDYSLFKVSDDACVSKGYKLCMSVALRVPGPSYSLFFLYHLERSFGIDGFSAWLLFFFSVYKYSM